MRKEEELSTLREELSKLQEALQSVREENRVLKEQLAAAHKRIEELEKQKTPPAFVKANVVKPQENEKKTRKKRDPEHNRARQREEPTQIIAHPIECCPDCGGRLSAQHVARHRQVLEIAPPPPVEVIEHQVYRGWCSYCRRWREAPLDLSQEVLGQGRLGVGLASVIAYLRMVLRMPIRLIRQYLQSLHGLKVSVGEITELLHRISKQSEATVQALREQARASPVVHADETGWRENGRNGYVWVLATADGLRYFEYHHSRAGEVVSTLLGKKFKGVLISDFYGGYNDYACPHQRCWVHLLRDLHDLKEKQAKQEEVVTWAKQVKALYEQAVASKVAGLAEEERQAAYVQLVSDAKQLGAQYAQAKKHPCQALARRLLRHQDELFQFVLRPEVPAHNNLAERSIRPLVVTRKISGGSRSPKGSATRMTLASLFGTWLARQLNPLEQCRLLLSLKSPLP